MPGVEAVGLTDGLPLGDNFGWRGWTVSPKERATDPGARANPLVRMIDDGYFTAMRIAMKAGRGFSAEDHPSSERVVVINQAFVAHRSRGGFAVGMSGRTNGAFNLV